MSGRARPVRCRDTPSWLESHERCWLKRQSCRLLGGGGGVARGNVSQNENEKEHLNLPPFWDTLSPLRSLPLWKNSRHITQTNG